MKIQLSHQHSNLSYLWSTSLPSKTGLSWKIYHILETRNLHKLKRKTLPTQIKELCRYWDVNFQANGVIEKPHNRRTTRPHKDSSPIAQLREPKHSSDQWLRETNSSGDNQRGGKREVQESKRQREIRHFRKGEKDTNTLVELEKKVDGWESFKRLAIDDKTKPRLNVPSRAGARDHTPPHNNT